LLAYSEAATLETQEELDPGVAESSKDACLEKAKGQLPSFIGVSREDGMPVITTGSRGPGEDDCML
jgi:hypothetical protein